MMVVGTILVIKADSHPPKKRLHIDDSAQTLCEDMLVSSLDRLIYDATYCTSRPWPVKTAMIDGARRRESTQHVLASFGRKADQIKTRRATIPLSFRASLAGRRRAPACAPSASKRARGYSWRLLSIEAGLFA